MPEIFKKEWCELVFNDALTPIIVFDPLRFSIIEVNSAAEKATGIRRDVLLGKNIFDLLPAKNRPKYLEILKEHLLKGGVREFSVDYTGPSGNTASFLATSYFIKPEGRQFIVLIFQEINKTREESQKREAEFQSLISNINQGVYTTKNGIFIRVNNTMSKIFGYSEKELLGMPSWNLAKPEIREKVKETFFRKTAERDFTPVEVVCVRKNGTEVIVEVSMNLLDHEVFGLVSDITERKKRECRKIEETELRFKKILDSMIEGCQIIGYDWRYMYLNHSLEKQSRFSRDKLIGKTMMECYPGIENTKMFSMLRKCMKDRVTGHMENEFEYPDGKKRWFELSVHPVPEGIFILTTDISEKKKIEHELRKTSKMLNDFIDFNPYSIQICDKQGHSIRENKAFLKLFKLRPPPWYSVFKDPVVKKYGLNLAAERAMKGEVVKVPYIWQDIHDVLPIFPKNPVCISLTFFPIFNENGEVENIVLMHEDITQRKKAEDELERYRQHLEELVDIRTKELSKKNIFLSLILNNIPSTICVRDAANMQFELFNKAGEQLFGIKKKEILGKDKYFFLPEDMAKKIESADHALIAGEKQLVVAEEQLHTRHGVKFLHSIKLPIKGKNRKINYVFSMCTDVTKQKIMEKRIEESERFLNNVVENIPDIVYVTDAKDFRIKLMNSAGEQLFGVNEKEIIGKTVSALFSKEIAELLEKKDAELMFKKSIVDVPELEFRGKNHPLILKLRKLPIFDNKGELTYILTIAENITHTKELEMVKSQFISSVSHELRSPITPIKAQVQRLIERDFDPKEKQAALESILRNTNRLDRLIQDILEINRIESGKLKIMKKEENLNNVISFAISDAEPVAKHRGTEIFYKQEKLPSVKLDRDRILEVLINLIDNATKYGKKKVWVSAKQSGKEIVVSVKDNGIGITKKELNSVFTPFYRAQRPEVLKYEGTGLGLSISKSIIELHGGRIWVESKLRKGSTFYFSLPLNGESHS